MVTLTTGVRTAAGGAWHTYRPDRQPRDQLTCPQRPRAHTVAWALSRAPGQCAQSCAVALCCPFPPAAASSLNSGRDRQAASVRSREPAAILDGLTHTHRSEDPRID